MDKLGFHSRARIAAWVEDRARASGEETPPR
jgi:hypothetical protein